MVPVTSDQKHLFDDASHRCGRVITNTYSTSFSLAIRFLNRDFHAPIHAIYGFVRLADEIVDSFHDFPKRELMQRLRNETFEAIDSGISLNPLLNAFQSTVGRYGIEHGLVDTFLRSMEMDLERTAYDQRGYEEYILGSAEVVGLMCLKVFCEGDEVLYERLKAPAMKLGSAFQKINFLRDMHTDHAALGRSYFPGIDVNDFNEQAKQRIEADILADFAAGHEGITGLPKRARFGVYLAYVYYMALFRKISGMHAAAILSERIRISDSQKATLLVGSYLRHSINRI
ncbi:MAG: phytoene/squalene synthase family protein [Flavobacteriales bacterium]|nr:phytoene/squalene synthase family protein [Flavobacteriales bacterium]